MAKTSVIVESVIKKLNGLDRLGNVKQTEIHEEIKRILKDAFAQVETKKGRNSLYQKLALRLHPDRLNPNDPFVIYLKAQQSTNLPSVILNQLNKSIREELFDDPKQGIKRLNEIFADWNRDQSKQIQRYPRIVQVFAFLLFGLGNVVILILISLALKVLALVNIITKIDKILINRTTMGELERARGVGDADASASGLNHLKFTVKAFANTLSRPWPPGITHKIGSFFARVCQAVAFLILFPLAIVMELTNLVNTILTVSVFVVGVVANQTLNNVLLLPLRILDGVNHLLRPPEPIKEEQEEKVAQPDDHDDHDDHVVDDLSMNNNLLHEQLGVAPEDVKPNIDRRSNYQKLFAAGKPEEAREALNAAYPSSAFVID
jgi:hypothetical protein